jgi:hypothetical protein
MPTVRVTHKSDLPQYFRERGLTLKNSLPGLMRQAGRLAAVSLAFQTQPFGDSEQSEALGKISTDTDIYRVYTTPGKAFADIQGSNPGAAKGFWKAAMARQWDRAKKILSKSGNVLQFTPIQPFDDGSAHRQLRNNQGRIPKSQKPVMIVQNTSQLKSYVTLEMNKVGYGKGGWATCARALGGIRGIPRWVHKHASPGTVIENYGTAQTSITLINQVTYASSILSPAGKSDAVRIAAERLFSSLRIASQGRKVTQLA